MSRCTLFFLPTLCKANGLETYDVLNRRFNVADYRGHRKKYGVA